MKNLLQEELIGELNSVITTEENVFSTNMDIVEELKKTAIQYNMAHGSHNQHSSSKDY